MSTTTVAGKAASTGLTQTPSDHRSDGSNPAGGVTFGL